MSVKIEYGGVAVGAKESFVPTASDKTFFSELSELQQELMFPNYGNPCELYSVVLDGNSLPLDVSIENNHGWWSEQTSDKDGYFDVPIMITLTAEEQYTSSGITLMFDIDNNIFANDINIKWYRGEELLSDMDFAPDSAFYFCQNKVEYYNKIIIVFNRINMPYNRMKLRSIEYGMRIVFGSDELINANINQEINPISTEIPISVFNFTLNDKRNIEYSFQERQPITVYLDDNVKMTSFVSDAKRKSKYTWNVITEDYIGILDNFSFVGGMYIDEPITSILDDIFGVANVPYNISQDISEERINGYIPYTSCRNALLQVAFSVGAIVDTSNSDEVNIYRIDNNNTKKHYTPNDIMQGQSVDIKTRVTAVEIASHSYIPIDDEIILYESAESGEGEKITVIFDNPVHDLIIVNGYIIESGVNYAKITAWSDCVLSGKTYRHDINIGRIENPLTLAFDRENIISIQSATLVNNNNIDKLLNSCYTYYANNDEVQAQLIDKKKQDKYIEPIYGNIVYGRQKYGSTMNTKTTTEESVESKVGDIIIIDTSYSGEFKGIVVNQKYNLGNGIIVKNSKVRRTL